MKEEQRGTAPRQVLLHLGVVPHDSGNVIADVHLPIEGEQSPSRWYSCKHCNSPRIIKRGKKNGIQHYRCNDCKKIFSEGRTIFPYPCVECDELITNAKNIGKRFCDDCIKKHRALRLKRWKEKNPEKNPIYCIIYRRKQSEIYGFRYEERTLITKCVICGQDISMYPAWCKRCMNCRENNLHDLGSFDFSQHMKRRYDDVVKTVIPDFEGERRAIDSMMMECGLK